MGGRRSKLILGVVAALTALFLVALALNLSPYLRGPDEWRWAYALPGQPARHLIPALVVMTYAVLAVWWGGRLIDKPSRRSLTGFLLVVWLAVPIIQSALLSADSPDFLKPLFYRTVSAGASGVFSVGSTINDPGDFLRHYPELMPTFPVHPQRYPPGLPMLFHAIRQPLEALPGLSDAIGDRLRLYQCHDLNLMRLSNPTIATATLQMVLPLLSGLVLFPLYGLAHRMGGRCVAVWAVILYPLVPSFALWSARWDQFYPSLAVLVWYLFHVGLTKSRRAVLFAAGLVLSWASFLSFGLLTALLPMGLWALFYLLTHRADWSWQRLCADGLGFGTGLVAPWFLYQLAFGSGLLDIWRVSMSYHLGLARDYWTWLVYHLYDFFIFLGLPLALLFLLTVAGAVRDLRRRRVRALPLAVGLGMLILDLSGTARGEVARVWLFWTPFATLVAACGLAQFPRLRQRALIVTLLAAQLLVFNAYLRVVTTGITDPPARQRVFAAPQIATPLEAQLGDGVRLLGYHLVEPSIPGEQPLRLTLYWEALKPMRTPYTVFTHLLGPDGALVGGQDNMPLRGNAPTTCWVPGEVIADPYDIAIGSDVSPGAHTLKVGMYNWETGERLPASGPTATPNGQVILTTVVIARE